MDEKKLPQADIERDRSTRMLLAFLLVLACCFAALQWMSGGGTDSLEDYDEEWAQDIDMTSVPMQAELIAMEPPKNDVEQPEEIRIVEKKEESEKKSAADSLSNSAADSINEGADVLQPIPQSIADLSAETLDFHVVERLPEFPGGPAAWIKWLTKNLRYPAVAQRQKRQGKVVAQFIINADGTISDIKIVVSANPMLDRETLRVLRIMPKWKPGIDNDQPCRTLIRIPVVFKL